MRSSTRAERIQIPDKLFEAERDLWTQPNVIPRRLERGQPIRLNHLQGSLAAGEIILVYALGSPKSHCLVITHREIRTVVLPDRDRIEGAVDVYLGHLRSRKAGKDSARRLYDMPIDPLGLGSTVGRVIVVPDGKLHLLPFDAILDSRGN